MSLVENKKAGFSFTLEEKYEAGLELLGAEVKAIRQGQGKLDGAHVGIRGGEAYLLGASIPSYQTANAPDGYDPERPRRLLLSRSEIKSLLGQESRAKLTLVPLAMYNKNNRIKLSFAVARHKKKYDKRETIKKRETDREMGRDLKGDR